MTESIFVCYMLHYTFARKDPIPADTLRDVEVNGVKVTL